MLPDKQWYKINLNTNEVTDRTTGRNFIPVGVRDLKNRDVLLAATHTLSRSAALSVWNLSIPHIISDIM